MSKRLRQWLGQYADILRFVVVLLLCHLFWKYTLVYDEHNLEAYDVRWVGIDLSALFCAATQQVADVVYCVLHMFDSTVQMDGTRIIFSNSHSMKVVWACSGLKQMFILLAVVGCARGRHWHKLWYLPAGIAVCYVYNVLRIAFLGWIVESHFEYYDLFHSYITKYLFYAIIFAVWLLWNEKFGKKR